VRRSWFVALVGQLSAAALAGQGQPALDQRLDAQTLAALRPVLDSARSDSLPEQALEDKALEGVAKHVPPLRILAAVRQLAGELRGSRALLRSAAPGVALNDGEIVAASDAGRRGVPTTEVFALRAHAPATTGLVVAFTVLGDLVQRGVPAERARTVIEQLLAAGVPPEQIAAIPAHMDVGLRLGAPPLDALRSALPIPVRPVSPRAAPPAPKPDRTGQGLLQP
jgi:hypothetical protein